MPTLGFLYDRFVDHQASLNTTELGPRDSTIACPVCGEKGSDALWLTAHLRTAHPLTAPVLTINGRVLPAETSRPRENNPEFQCCQPGKRDARGPVR